MTEEPRYSLRRRSVALTRTQWTIDGAAVVAVIGGAIVMGTFGLAEGAIVMAVGSIAISMVVAFGRFPK